jgi:hypothetical protein
MSKTNSTANEKKVNPAIEQLKRLHSAQAIERKDMGLRDYIAKFGTDGAADLAISGMMSKFIPKYEKDATGQRGYFTMLYLAGGMKIGAFSNALYDLATFFYSKLPGYSDDGHFFKFEFTCGDVLNVHVSTVPLDGGKSTYNFEIVDGVLEHSVSALMDPAEAGHMLTATNALSLEAAAADPEE